MKISGAIIQPKNIRVSNEHQFEATYKGRLIVITDDHGFGKPKYDHLTRFCIDVIHIESGMKDVDSYEDFHCIKDAIRSALIGARLIQDYSKR